MNHKTLSDYGIDPRGRSGEIHTHCPECIDLHNNNNETLSVNTDKLVWLCHRCGWSGAVKSGTGLYLPKNPQQTDSRPWAKASIDKTLKDAVHISQSPEVLEYLINRLGELPDPLPKLGARKSLAYYEQKECTGYYPAMLGTMRDVSGKMVSVHRTYIQNGKKAPVDATRKMMTAIKFNTIIGSAIRLYEPEEELIVAEGIETALAVFIATGIPVWATTSAGCLAAVVIPDTVKKLTIAGDNDYNRTGQDKADQLALRYQHIETKLMIPPKAGQDWLDVLKEGA